MRKLIFDLSFLFIFSFLFNSQIIFSQWNMLDGPYETHGVKYLLNHPNGTLFAVGYNDFYENNTIYKSTNSGESWNKVFISSSSYYQLSSLSADSEDGIYAGTRGGYYYSSDNGENWSFKSVYVTSWSVSSLVHNSSGNILVGIAEGIYLSNDSGYTWTQVLNRGTRKIINYLNDTLYASTNGGIYLSTNAGISWVLRNNGLPNVQTYQIAKNSVGHLFTNTEEGIYKSTDKGANWFLPDSSAYLELLDLYIDKNDILYGCTWLNYSLGIPGVYRSRNDGFNWEYLGLGNRHEYHINCVMVDNNNVLYAGNDRSLFKYSETDSTWSLGNIYRSLGNIKAFNFCEDNSILASTSMRLSRSDDLGLSWNFLNDTNTPLVITTYDDRVIISGSYNSLFYSEDCGEDWYSTINLDCADKIYCDTNNVLYAGLEESIYKSIDDGSTWNLLMNFFPFIPVERVNDLKVNSLGQIFISQFGFTGPPFIEMWELNRITIGGSNVTIYTNLEVYSIEIDQNDQIFIGTRGGGVLKSNDNGNTFLTISTGLTNLYINDLIISPEGVLLAATNNGVHRYVDSLNQWVLVDNTGLISPKIHNMQFKNDVLFVGTDIGLAYFSGPLPVELTSLTAATSNLNVQLFWSTATELNNHGFEIERSIDKTSWATIGFREGKGTTSEPQDYSYSDDISEISLSKLYYRLKQVDFNGTFEYSKIVEVEIAPTKFYLQQNYPNPFNPSTSIQYAISSRQLVTLKVYDVLGKEIATLVNEEKFAGNYETEFNASHLASGIYYYQLKAGDYVETKKMVLIK